MPPAAQVRDALETVLSSDVFARSERARDLLRYVVTQDLAGNADRLKGFSIAVDVFGKNDKFDPSTDTVVRVQAGRLRELLEQYYAGEGAQQPLRIAIPRGNYAPIYTVVDDVPQCAEPATPDEEPAADEAAFQPVPSIAATPWRNGSVWAAAFAGVLAVAIALYVFIPRVSPDRAIAGAELSLADMRDVTGSAVRDFLPSIYIDATSASADTGKVVALLRRGLSGFDTVSLIARAPYGNEQGAHVRTDFVMMVEDGADDSVHLEIQNVLSGKVLLSRTLETQDRTPSALEDDIADFLTSIVRASGSIYLSLAETGSETVLTRCLALNEKFYHDQNEEAHRAAYDCLKSLADMDFRSGLVYSELAGLQVQALASRYDYPPDRSEAQALAYARMAVHLSPQSPYAHRSMGHVLSRTSSLDESLRWARKAYELNTFDLSVAASLGYRLIFTGEYPEGTALLERAVTAASAHPNWWDYGLGLGYLMLDEPAAMADAAAALTASNRAHYRALRLVAAHETGNESMTASLRDQIKQGNRTFAADPLAFFERGGYPEDLTERFLRALNQAGLSDPS